MPSNYLCYNNKFYQSNQAVFGLNRALKYGDGLFETIRVKEGSPCYLNSHFNRLKDGLAILKIDLSEGQLNEIEVCINQLLIKNEVDKNGKLRLTVYRGGGGTYKPDTRKADYFIEAEALPDSANKMNNQGMQIDISNEVIIYPNRYTAIKTMNSLPYIQAAIEAKEREMDELILLNNYEGIVEATSSSIFLVKKQEVYTPPLSEGCLNGIMRSKVMETAKKLNYKVTEIPLKKEALLVADEVFLTNSIKKIQWVGAYRKKRYFSKLGKLFFESIY